MKTNESPYEGQLSFLSLHVGTPFAHARFQDSSTSPFPSVGEKCCKNPGSWNPWESFGSDGEDERRPNDETGSNGG